MKVLSFILLINLSLAWSVFAKSPDENPGLYARLVHNLDVIHGISSLDGNKLFTGPVASIYASNAVGFGITDIIFTDHPESTGPFRDYCSVILKMTSRTGEKEFYAFAIKKEPVSGSGYSSDYKSDRAFKETRDLCVKESNTDSSVNDDEINKEAEDNLSESVAIKSSNALKE